LTSGAVLVISFGAFSSPYARLLRGQRDQEAAQEDAQAQEAEAAQARPTQAQALIPRLASIQNSL
jgi:hypothetical protein